MLPAWKPCCLTCSCSANVSFWCSAMLAKVVLRAFELWVPGKVTSLFTAAASVTCV
jgi:hypothetical protein